MNHLRPAHAPRPVADADEGFCIEILPEVSRTFALSIELLPEALREPVRLGYLLCRVADTLEDDPCLTQAAREDLFDAFLSALDGSAEDADVFEALVRISRVGTGAERRLALHTGAVLRRLRRQDPDVRADLLGPVRTMVDGMRAYTRRVDVEGRLRLRDIPDLERYCYFVAGTVGELLTPLFLRTCPLDGDARRHAEDRAVAFGLGLQLVNIVKDCAEDQQRGVCFLPVEVADRHGVAIDQLLDPDHREAAMAVVSDVVGVARDHLARAVGYTAAWPADGAHGSDVRLFCLVPLLLAVETLGVVVAGQDTLVPGATPKVSRAVVERVVQEAHAASRDDTALATLLDRYGLEAQ